MKTVVLTGATGAISGGIAEELASHGANLVLLGRTQTKLDERVAFLQSRETENESGATITTELIDFCDYESIKSAAAAILEKHDTIEALVMSVALPHPGPPVVLAKGHEKMFFCNVVGPFLLQKLLLPRLEASHGMIMTIITDLEKQLTSDFQGFESWNVNKRWKASSIMEDTKYMINCLIGEFSRRQPEVVSIAFKPGSGFIAPKKGDPVRYDLKFCIAFFGYILGPIVRMMVALTGSPPSVPGIPASEIILRPTSELTSDASLLYFDLAEKRDPLPAMLPSEYSTALYDYIEGLIAGDSLQQGPWPVQSE